MLRARKCGLVSCRTGYVKLTTAAIHTYERFQALLSVFKKRMTDAKERDTALEQCEVDLQAKPAQIECRLIIQMICRHGVVKTYRLTYESVEVLHATFDKTVSKNCWSISSHTLRDVVEYFGPKTEQLDWFYQHGKFTFTSYTEKVQNGRGKDTMQNIFFIC